MDRPNLKTFEVFVTVQVKGVLITQEKRVLVMRIRAEDEKDALSLAGVTGDKSARAELCW